MKATAPSGGGGGGGAETVKPKRRKKAGGGGFIFGCGGSKSVAVVAGNLSTMALAKASSSSTAATAKPAPKGKQPAPSCHRHDADGAQSVDALLGQLRELERGVRALGVRVREEDGAQAQACRCSARPRHRRDAWGGGSGRLEESVAVVTETEDPLGEFRRSMAEMVVENGITGGAELRELLQRFLSLNSVRHHHLILRAFADVWEELFAGPGDPTQKHNHKHKQKRPVVSPAGHSARASS